MAKKKKGVSDKVNNRRTPAGNAKVNPFEIKINNQKHTVLGRKVTKDVRGMPGVSRSRALKKRKETLLHEYKEHGKANRLIDKRIGENNPTLNVEEKMLKRFTLERRHHQKKTQLYNLNDDEELTHYGQSLAEIEKFEDPVESDEDDEEGGRLSAKLVGEELFGGFLTKKEEEAGGATGRKSWKEKMQELISQSKKAKYERQAQKEKTLELTTKLDQEWKNVMHLVAGVKKKKGENSEPKGITHADDYDIKVRELMFEVKGNPSDRLKTEEELAKEEKKRLEKLETDRVHRMKGRVHGDVVPEGTHISADDLSDGILLKDRDTGLPKKSVKFLDSLEPDDEDDEEEKADKTDKSGMDDENVEANADESADDEESDSDDSFQDIESDDNDEDKDDDEEKEDNSASDVEMTDKDAKEMSKKKSILKQSPRPSKATESAVDSKVRKEMMETAKKELPYTFTAPDSYGDLLSLFEGRTADEQLTIIERVRKCHHVSLAENNKQKMQTFFSLLLLYCGDLANQVPPQLYLLDKLPPHLYELAQQSPFACGQGMLDVIKEKQHEYQAVVERRNGKGIFPMLDTLLYLKMVSVLFPTSDFKHHVVTPTFLFLGQLLAQSSVNNERDVAAGLFLCNLSLEYVSLSRRYVPEAVNFLHGCLFLAADKDPGKFEAVIPPFKPVGKQINLLKLDADCSSNSTELERFSIRHTLATDVSRKSLNTDLFRLQAIHTCLDLLIEFSHLYNDLPSYKEIFSPVCYMCSKISIHKYPHVLQVKLKNLQELASEFNSSRHVLVMQTHKPQPLKMFEPKIMDIFDDKKSRAGGGRMFNDKQRLLHRHKREKKAAVREIRRDNQFLARIQLQEQVDKDSERKTKVRRLYGELSRQEGDYKALKRMKEKS